MEVILQYQEIPNNLMKFFEPIHQELGSSVFRISTRPFRGEHFAVYPPALIETPIKAGCPEGGVVLDPFMGSGTTALVARQFGRNFIGIELNPDYVRLARRRLAQAA